MPGTSFRWETDRAGAPRPRIRSRRRGHRHRSHRRLILVKEAVWRPDTMIGDAESKLCRGGFDAVRAKLGDAKDSLQRQRGFTFDNERTVLSSGA